LKKAFNDAKLLRLRAIIFRNFLKN
jgi:hypothetical protein